MRLYNRDIDHDGWPLKSSHRAAAAHSSHQKADLKQQKAVEDGEENNKSVHTRCEPTLNLGML